jgi:general secretion pathway protein A
MSYLQYGLSQAEGFIVITGDIGTGKTTIANSLLDSLEEDIFAAQIVTPKLSPDEIVKMVASKFELNVTGKSKAEILDDLERFLNQLAAQGKRALLLVDEAQNLPLETIEELRMLSNFQKAGKPLLQSFLLGQDELQPILRAPNMEQFRQRIVASCHLAPLNSREAREYIEFRLQHAGYAGKGLFSDDAFTMIHDFSRGVPRRMNTLMDRILLYGFLEEIEFFEEEQVNIVIDEVKSEMFVPDNQIPAPDDLVNSDPEALRFTAKGTEIHEAQYYKNMLHELVDALDDALKHKIKLTQYIDKLLKKKYQTYMRLKSDDH